jgi:hypothetical protein
MLKEHQKRQVIVRSANLPVVSINLKFQIKKNKESFILAICPKVSTKKSSKSFSLSSVKFKNCALLALKTLLDLKGTPLFNLKKKKLLRLRQKQ